MLTLEQAYEQQGSYQANETERAKVADVTFIAAVGAVASGKNFFMHESGFHIVGTDTSRGYRNGDDTEKYTYPTVDEMLDRVEHGVYIQYGVHLPHSIYATHAGHYEPGAINIKDIWFDAVKLLENKGFKSVKSISVLTPADQWQGYLDDRFYGATPGYITDRLNEAKHSIRWSVTRHLSKTANHLLVINDDEQTVGNLDRIREFAHGDPVEPLDDTLVNEIANQMFMTIKNYNHQRNSEVA